MCPICGQSNGPDCAASQIILTNDYPFPIFQENGLYCGYLKSAPGVWAQGETGEECRKVLAECLETWKNVKNDEPIHAMADYFKDRIPGFSYEIKDSFDPDHGSIRIMSAEYDSGKISRSEVKGILYSVPGNLSYLAELRNPGFWVRVE